jgi:hypothetical protein
MDRTVHKFKSLRPDRKLPAPPVEAKLSAVPGYLRAAEKFPGNHRRLKNEEVLTDKFIQSSIQSLFYCFDYTFSQYQKKVQVLPGGLRESDETIVRVI